jgi:DUF917 family protein
MGIRLKINKETVEAAVLGGAVLGGGGGGWIEEGRELARFAVERGFREILPIEDVPEDALLLTVSAVGAPSAGSAALKPDDYVRAVELFLEKTGIEVGGLISSEIGGLGIVNGWVQSAFLNISVVDAPCNGRSHPLGLMGSMGLHRDKGYVSFQAAVGWDKAKGNRVEDFFKGTVQEVSKLVREVSIKAGGLVAVARNPVPAHYVKKKGAPGAIQMALGLGKIMLKRRKTLDRKKMPGRENILKSKRSGSAEAVKEIVDRLGGNFQIKASVEKLSLRREGGLDIGKLLLREQKRHYELTFWNEYMTLEADNRRIATFPDLIMTFDSEAASPLISAEIKENCEVFVIAVPSHKLILGAGLGDPALLKSAEDAVGKEILRYRKTGMKL